MFTNLILLLALILLGIVTFKLQNCTRNISELEDIISAVAEDIQEVRTVTHGAPKINIPLI